MHQKRADLSFTTVFAADINSDINIDIDSALVVRNNKKYKQKLIIKKCQDFELCHC